MVYGYIGLRTMFYFRQPLKSQTVSSKVVHPARKGKKMRWDDDSVSKALAVQA